MTTTHKELRNLFSEFWKQKEHKEVPPIPLVPQNDPTTLFTGSGMQQLVPYLLGEPHPLGKKLYNIQPAFRAQDIEEVGDNRHTTFFEMVGNWSLGTYFKQEQLTWCWEFFTQVLHLPKERLHVTIFEGSTEISKDTESYEIWKKLAVQEDHIHWYDAKKNWWSRAGVPENMPAGEPGGPDSEIFYDFGKDYKFHENSQYKNDTCHPNCDCGRFVEIGNTVFMQYKKNKDGSFSKLPDKNVDFGGGFERILMAVQNKPDVFKTDIFEKVLSAITETSKKEYKDANNVSAIRVIADHMRASTFIIKAGVFPSNKGQGYILRRLLRRSAVKLRHLTGSMRPEDFSLIARQVLTTYGDQYFNITEDEIHISTIVDDEMKKFEKSLDRGLKEFEKYSQDQLNPLNAFNLFQSYGFPFEISQELFREKGIELSKTEFDKVFKAHQDLSRTASVGMFKGGLADQSEQTLKYHTATHLLHQALFDVLGNDIKQEGSNITGERLRFDFSSSKKPTEEDKKKVEEIMNTKIKESIPVNFKIMPKAKAEQVGAKSFFREKYPDQVKVYYISPDETLEHAYSKEFCGGPHVKNTKEIGRIEIYKMEKIGSNLYRIYAK